jgi:hypothetical protein
MSTKESSTQSFGKMLQLVAYDERLAFYTDPESFESIMTVRRDKKPMTRRDRKEADKQINFLLHDNPLGNC